MLNCGMTQVDISDLHPSEVDWDRGRIRRKRSKTDDHEHVPTVDYPLWPRDLESAPQVRPSRRRPCAPHRIGSDMAPGRIEGPTASGRRSMRSRATMSISSGRRPIRSDEITPEDLGDPDRVPRAFRRYTGHFLGHAPSSLAERHYAAPSKELFDLAITWLGHQMANLCPAFRTRVSPRSDEHFRSQVLRVYGLVLLTGGFSSRK